MKRIALFLLLLPLLAFGQGRRQPLRVLYVGGTADLRTFDRDTTGMAANVEQRMAAFEQMLGEYFDKVEAVHASEYSPALSEGYDVTVIDGLPPEISKGRYFPDSFARPVLTIGEMGQRVGRANGIKVDWYCLCVDADALRVRTKHPIFKGPFAVKPTFVTKPTPEHAFSYPYYGDVPKELPMWRVPKVGYSEDRTLRAGLIARGWGFEDSPEAEIISGGVSQKSLDAAAIARHGNFLHWGFAASPDNLTPEARAALANAIVYIAKFNGHGIIARKLDDRMLTRDYLKERIYGYGQASFQSRLRAEQRMADMYTEWQQVARAKKARGEELTEREEELQDYVAPAPMTFAEYVKAISPADLYALFGADPAKYIAYYDQNRDYFRAVLRDGSYSLELDDDARTLGIANNDPRLLERAIELLEKGENVELAQRVLTRYTLQRFQTPEQWRQWFNAARRKLFFTESGGWLFLENGGANDYSLLQPRSMVVAEPVAQALTAKTSDTEPVHAAAAVVGNEVQVTLTIHPGYHLYATVSDVDPYIPTELEVVLPSGATPSGPMVRPAAVPYGTSGTTVLNGTVVFSQPFSGTVDAGSVICRLSYQCCNNHICLPPTEKELVIK